MQLVDQRQDEPQDCQASPKPTSLLQICSKRCRYRSVHTTTPLTDKLKQTIVWYGHPITAFPVFSCTLPPVFPMQGVLPGPMFARARRIAVLL